MSDELNPVTSLPIEPGDSPASGLRAASPKTSSPFSYAYKSPKASNLMLGEAIGTTETVDPSKFGFGVIGGQDYKEIRAQKQGVGEHLLYGTGRFLGTTLTKLGTGVGYLGGLVNPSNWGEGFISKAADNGWVHFFEDLEQDLKESMPIHHTNAYMDGNVFQQMATLGFWSNDFVDGLAFRASTWIPGIGLATLGLGLRMAPYFSRSLRAAKTGSLALPKLAKTAANIDRITTFALMTSMEAMFEAKEVRDAIRVDLRGKINPATEKPFTPEEINRLAAEKARDTYVMNAIALAPSNFLETGFIFKKLPAARSLGSRKLIQKSGTYELEELKGFAKFWDGYAGQVTKGLIVGHASEGLWEENVQLSIQHYNERTARLGRSNTPSYSGITEFPNVLPGLIENLSTHEGQKSIMLGTLIGAPAAVRSNIVNKKQQQKRLDGYVDKKSGETIPGALQEIFNAEQDLNKLDVYKRTPDRKINIKRGEEGNYTITEEEVGVEGGSSTRTVGKEEYERFASENDMDAAKTEDSKNIGGELLLEDVVNDLGEVIGSQPVVDNDKLNNFLEAKTFGFELEDLIDAEENKENANQSKVNLLKNEKFTFWALAHFKAGTGEDLFNKLKQLKGLSAEELLTLGYDPNLTGVDAETAIDAQIKLAEKLEEMYNSIELGTIPKGTSTEAYIQNQKRKKDLFFIGSRVLKVEEELDRVKSKSDALFSEIRGSEEDLLPVREINALVALKEAQEARIDDIAATSPDSKRLDKAFKKLEEIEAKIKKAKTEYNEGNENPVDVNTDSLPMESLVGSPIGKMYEMEVLKVAELQLSLEELYLDWDSITHKFDGHENYKEYIDDIMGRMLGRILDMLPLTDKTTAEQYAKYEKGKLRKERIKAKIKNVKLRFLGFAIQKRLETNEEGDTLVNIIKDIVGGNLNLDAAGFKVLEDAVNSRLVEIQEVMNQKQVASETGDMEALISLDAQLKENNYYKEELKVLNDVLTTGFKDRHLRKPVDFSDDQIRRKIADRYSEESENILNKYNNSEEYADLVAVQQQIQVLENLIRVFEERGEDIEVEDKKGKITTYDVLTTKPFKGFLDKIKKELAELKAAETVVGERVVSRERQDEVILNTERVNAYKAVGIDIVASISENTIVVDESTRLVYEELSRILGETFFQDILNQAKDFKEKRMLPDDTVEEVTSKFPLIFAEGLMQVLRNNHSSEGNENERGVFQKELQALIGDTLKKVESLPIIDSIFNGTVGPSGAKDLYPRNPAVYIKELLPYFLDDSAVEDAVREFYKNGDLEALMATVWDKTSPKSVELKTLLALHYKLLSLYRINSSLSTTNNIVDSSLDERMYIKSILEELEGEKENFDTPIPNTQQLIAIRQIIQWFTTPFDSTTILEDAAYLKGYAGTGKTKVVCRWAAHILGLDESEIYAVAHNEYSSKEIRDSVTPSAEPKTLDDLISALNSNSSDLGGISLLIIDEVGALSKEKFDEVSSAVTAYNEKNGASLKTLYMGDPNQITYEGTAPLENMITTKDALNITTISPLTIRFRSDVGIITQVQDMFLAQNKDITSSPIMVKSNVEDPANTSEDLYGVDGDMQFTSKVKSILRSRDHEDGRRRVIIVGMNEVEKYTEEFSQEIAEGKVEVMDYVSVQGQTINEVYVNISKFNSEFRVIQDFNTAMYTATSRASDYLFLGGMPIKHYKSLQLISTENLVDAETKAVEFDYQRSVDQDVLSIIFGDDIATEEEEDDDIMGPPSDDIAPEGPKEEEDSPVVEEEEEEEGDDAPTDDQEGGTTPKGYAPIENDYIPFQEEEEEKEVEIAPTNNYSHPLQHTHNNGLKKGVKEGGIEVYPAVKNGDKTYFVVDRYQDRDNNWNNRVRVVAEIVLEGDTYYREIGVLGEKDLAIMRTDSRTPALLAKTQAVLDGKNRDDFVVLQEEVFGDTKGLLYIDGKKSILEHPKAKDVVLASGTVRENSIIDFRYDWNNTTPMGPGSFKQLIEKYVISTYKDLDVSVKDLVQEFMDNSEVRIFTNKDVEDITNIKLKPGVPYLMLKNPRVLTEVSHYIELQPRKLNKDKDKVQIKHITNFINKVEEVENILNQGVEEKEHVKYGTPLFNKVVRDIADGIAYESREYVNANGKVVTKESVAMLLEKRGITIPKDKRSKKYRQLLKLSKDIEVLVFGVRKTKTRPQKDRLGNLVRDENGVVISEEYLARDGIGNAQDVINKLAMNNLVLYMEDTFLMFRRYKKAGTIPTGMHLLSKEKIKMSENHKHLAELIAQKKLKTATGTKREELLESIKGFSDPNKGDSNKMNFLYQHTSGMASLNQLKLIVNFDKNGDNNLNDGFGVRIPIRISDLNKINKPDIVDATDFEDGFSHVEPTKVVVDIDDTSIGQRNVEEVEVRETLVEESPIEDDGPPSLEIDEDDLDVFLLKEDIAESNLGSPLSKGKALNYLKKLMPGISESGVKFVSELEMMRLTGGKDAWGMLRDGIIYLTENADGSIYEDVIRHEVFHKAWHFNLTEQERLIAISQVRAEYPTATRGMDNNQVEEYLAGLYQGWRRGRVMVRGWLYRFFRRVAEWLNLVSREVTNIDDLFNRIDRGYFINSSKVKGEIGDRFLIKIKEDYDNIPIYKLAKRIFITKMHLALHGERKLAKRMTDKESHVVIREGYLVGGIPLDFKEATNHVLRTLTKVKEKLEKRIESGEELDSTTKAMYRSLVKLVNPVEDFKVFKEMVKDVYPGVTNIADLEEITLTAYEDIQEGDKVNHERGLSQRIRDFLVSLHYNAGVGNFEYEYSKVVKVRGQYVGRLLRNYKDAFQAERATLKQDIEQYKKERATKLKAKDQRVVKKLNKMQAELRTKYSQKEFQVRYKEYVAELDSETVDYLKERKKSLRELGRVGETMFVSTSESFRILLDIIPNLDFTSNETFIKSLGDLNYKTVNAREAAVLEALKKLARMAYTPVITSDFSPEYQGGENFPSHMKFRSGEEFIYSPEGKDITRLRKSNSPLVEDGWAANGIIVIKKGERTSSEWFRDILDLAFTDNTMSERAIYSLIRAMYIQNMNRNTLRDIRVGIGSLREKNMYRLEKSFDKGKQSIRYYKNKATGASRSASSDLKEGIISGWYRQVKNRNEGYFVSKDLYGKFKQTKISVEEKQKLIVSAFRELGVLGIAEDLVIKDVNITYHALRSLMVDINTESKTQITVQDDSDKRKNIKIDPPIEHLIKNQNKRVSGLAKVLSANSVLMRPRSYVNVDGTKRYMFVNSSHTYDVIKQFINKGVFKMTKEQLPRNMKFLKSVFFENNIFTGENSIGEIVDFIDHEGAIDKDGYRAPVLYKNEGEKDWLERVLVAQFLKQNIHSSSPTYIQQLWTNSNKPDVPSVKVKVLRGEKIREAIEAAIRQESSRVDHEHLSVYNKDTTYIIGMDRVLSKEEADNPKVMKKMIDQVLEAMDEKVSALIDKVTDSGIAPPIKGLNAYSVYSSIKESVKKSYTAAQLKKISNEEIDLKVVDILNSLHKKGGLFTEATAKKYNFNTEENIHLNLAQKGALESLGLSGVKAAIIKESVTAPLTLFYQNFWLNSHFLNQLTMGDQAAIKDSYTIIKRNSISNAIGYTGTISPDIGMRESFRVGVAQDAHYVITKQLAKDFKKIIGEEFDYADAQGFMTPERFSEVEEGFGPGIALGSTLKPVHWEIREDGTIVALKYSSIVLTDELCDKFPQLRELRKDMRTNKVDEYIFESGVKVGTPAELALYNEASSSNTLLNDSNIIELSNSNWRIQLNPVHEADAQISNPMQLLAYINSNGNNYEDMRVIQDLQARLIKVGMDKLSRALALSASGSKAQREAKLRKTLARTLEDVVGSERQYEFLTAKNPDGSWANSINLPILVDKLITQLSSTMAKRSIKIKFRGSKLVLQTAYGTKDIDKQGIPEVYWKDAQNRGGVYLPDIYKKDFEDAGALNPDGSVKAGFETVLGFRIPSTEIHSALPIKILGFYPSRENTNIIIAPKEIVFFHGSDYDIDALYIMKYWIPGNDIKNEKGRKIIKKGELTLEKNNTPLYDWVETEITRVIMHMKEASAENKEVYKEYLGRLRDVKVESLRNGVLNTYLKVVQDPKNQESMMTPISMNNFKGKSDKGAQESVFDMIVRIKGLDSHEELYPKRDLNDPVDQMQMHQDNFAGVALTGIYADMSKGVLYAFSSTYSNEESPTVQLPDGRKIMYNGAAWEKFSRTEKRVGEKGLEDNVVTIGFEKTTTTRKNGKITVSYKKDKSGKKIPILHLPTIYETYDSMINAAIDNVKEQILQIVNASDATASSFFGALALGIPLNDVVRIHMHPIMLEVAASKYADTGISKVKKMIKDKFKLPEEYTPTGVGVDSKWLEKGIAGSLEDFLENASDKDVSNAFHLLQLVSDLSIIGAGIGTVAKAVKTTVQDYPITYSEILEAIKNIDSTLQFDEGVGNFKKGVNPLELTPVMKAQFIRRRPALFKEFDNITPFKRKDVTYYMIKPETSTSQLVKIFDEYFSKEGSPKLINRSLLSKTKTQLKRMSDVERADWMKEQNEIDNLKEYNFTNSSFVLSNLDIFLNPNLKQGFEGLKKLKTVNEKVFYKHHKFLQDKSSKLRLGIKFKKNYNKLLKDEEFIRNEFVKYMLSGVEITLEDGTPYKFDTEDTPSFAIPGKTNAKGEPFVVYGAEAWAQEFIVKVKELKKQYPDNKFLRAIEIDTGKVGNMYLEKINYTSGGILEQADILEFEDSFRELANEDGSFSLIQYDFVKYDLISRGIRFGSNSYALLLPPDIYSKLSKELDILFEKFLPTRLEMLIDSDYATEAAQNTNSRNQVLEGLTEKSFNGKMRDSFIDHFTLQFALNNMDSLPSAYSVMPDLKKHMKRGVHNGATYDLAFKLPESTKEGEEIEVVDAEKFPLFLVNFGDQLLMRVPSKAQDKLVMYQRVGKKDNHGYYLMNKDLFEKDYALERVISRELRSLFVKDNKNLTRLEYANEYLPAVDVGQTIRLVRLGDKARGDVELYKIKSITPKPGAQITVLQLKYVGPSDVIIERELTKDEENVLIQRSLEPFKNEECK